MNGRTFKPAISFLFALATALASTLCGVRPVEAAPWSAPATTDVVVEPKSFEDQGATLQGTLYLPKSLQPVGAVVVVHGASSPLRTSPLYRHLTAMLPSLGMAVLVYDRRGAGRSTGTNTGDFTQLADDAVAAVRLLEADPRIDPRRVGIWGLSQGGWLSLLAASRSPEVAFAVSISAPLTPPDVQMMFSSTNSLRVNGYSQAQIDQMVATRKAVDDYMRGTTSRAEAQRRIDVAKTEPWFKYLYMGTTLHDRATSSWRRELQLDPLATFAGVHCPALILFGADDPVVPVAVSMERLKPVLATHANISAAVIADADHDMQVGVDPKTLLDPGQVDAGAPNSPAYFGLLASWLTAQGLAKLHVLR